MQLVVRDLLGRQQVITQQYYGARTLLRRELEDYSYEFGAVRENFAAASNDYGQLQFTGTHRRGFTDRFTGEARGELRPDRQTLGGAGTMLIGKIGVLDVAVAGSHNDNGGGGLVTLGFERQTQRLGFGVNTRLASRYFEQNGLPPRGRVPLAQTTAHIGWNAARFGSFGLSYIRRDNRGEPDNEIISANYSLNIGGNWFVALSAFKNMKGSQDYSVGFMLTRAIGKRTTASVNVNQRSGPDSLLFQVQQNLPAGAGVGYRVLAGPENHGRLEGTLNLQNNFGTLTLEAGRVSGLEAYRASATGGMAVLGGRAFLSRSLGDSFAVVHVPSYPNVRVYAENQEGARTDKSGVALVPRLRPYQ